MGALCKARGFAMASALGGLFRNDSWNFPVSGPPDRAESQQQDRTPILSAGGGTLQVPGGQLLRTTSSGNYTGLVDSLSAVLPCVHA